MSDVLENLRESLAGRYRIDRELGHGGMATVYLADDLKHGRKVAVKVMRPDVAEAIGHERFLREIEIAARLTHPHILPLHDSGAAGSQFYYVMPYIAGESLRERLHREWRFPIDEALRLTREIAGALGHAHHRGLVHRDIKPENVLLAEGIALVADFGIARSLSTGIGGDPVASSVSSVPADPSGMMVPPTTVQSAPAASVDEASETIPMMAPTRSSGMVAVSSSAMTQAGAAIGTPLYMAPEQAAGSADVDGRADQYSLACVLFEMLAGRPPFMAHTIRELVALHANEPVPTLSRERADVPEAVARAIERALAKQPADRYESMARFAEALAVTALAATTTVPPHEGAKVPNNLLKQRTHFIGRENELAECMRLMGETRLLTLTGIGGCGKTRIAIRLAETLLASYPDGMWFVDLAPLQDADRVALTSATTLGIREEPGTPILETLARHLATQRAMVVLDNCEHVIEATATLVDRLLAVSSELKLIVTSREGLGVAGERVYAVRSLKLPAVADAKDMGAIEASDSVRLFVDRARQVVPDYSLTPETTLAVAEICRRLDGIPLAIEFAAARVELLSVEQIRAKLDDRFRLLTGGSRALPRHQTLQATIQWSYDHLAPGEQHLFRLLSVFAGGWTLAGISAVQQDGADEFEVLDLLGNLVRKSLIYVRRDGTQEPRYHMLETVRQYSQMRLDESGEADATRTRHLDFYLSFVNEVGLKLVGPEQGECLRRLDRDLDNLLAAHDWCNRAPDGGSKGLRLLTELPLYWGDRGMLDLGLKLFREALARPSSDLPLRARVLSAAGSLAFRQGLYDDAHQFADESLSIARECRDPERTQFALHLLGAVAHSRGDLAGAGSLYEEGLALARKTGAPRALADLLNALAMVQHGQGRLDAAAELYQESLAFKRQLGNLRDVGIVSLNLAQLELQRGGLDKARASVLEGMKFVEDTGSRVGARTLLDTAAGVAAAEADWPRAARLFGAADGVLSWAVAPRDPGDERVMVPMIERTRNALGAETFESAYSSGQALLFEEGLAEVRAWLAGEQPPGSFRS